jgi:hypothetical protein
MTVIQENVGKMETQLETWGTKLDELVAAAQKKGTETKAEYRAQLDDLKAKHKAARSKFNELKVAGGSALDTFTTGAGSAWTELENGFKKLTN